MELLKETYNYKDIVQIIGCSKTKAYELISKTQIQFKEEYPNAILIDKKIPKWFFRERVLGERSTEDDKSNN